MTVVHTYFYIVVDKQRGCHTLKKTIEYPIAVIHNFLQSVTQTSVHFCVKLEIYARVNYDL